MKSFTYCAVLAAAASLCAEAKWAQPRLVISFWVDPVVNVSQFDARYAEIRNANFTAVLGGFGATSPADIQAQIAAAEAHDLGVFVHADPSIPIDQLPSSNSSSFWGYQVKDEPDASEFPDLASTVSNISEWHPDKLAFINLLPNYATDTQLGSANYYDYVQDFVDTVHPDVLCMDHYPLFTAPAFEPTNNMTRAGYRDNLAVLRAAALQADIPFWNFFNVMPYGSHEDPSLAQIRWQAFTSLTYGARGLLYFCYWSPGSFIGGGIVVQVRNTATGEVEFRQGPHYADATAVNSQILAYESVLMNATSSGVCLLDLPANGSIVQVQEPCKDTMLAANITQRGYARDGSLLIGQFDINDGRRAVLIVNDDDGFNVWPTLQFAIGSSNLREVDPVHGTEQPVFDESVTVPGLQLSFQSGGARLFVINAEL